MRHAAQKKIQPVTTKRATIYLLEGHTTIKLPVPENPVHKLQARLEKELSKKLPSPLRGVAQANPQGAADTSNRPPRPEERRVAALRVSEDEGGL
jgi:hypothetical protein